MRIDSVVRVGVLGCMLGVADGSVVIVDPKKVRGSRACTARRPCSTFW